MTLVGTVNGMVPLAEALLTVNSRVLVAPAPAVTEGIRPDEIRTHESFSSGRSRSLRHLLNGTNVWKSRDQKEAGNQVPLSRESDDGLGTEIRLRVKIQANPLGREATSANQDSFEKVYVGLSSGWQKTGILYSTL